MNKTILLLSAILACVNFSGCGDSNTQTPLGTKNLVIQDPGFGSVLVGDHQTKKIKFTNPSSTQEIEITDIKLDPVVNYYVVSNARKKILPNSSCEISVDFKPTASMLAMPARTVRLSVSYTINNKPETAIIELKGVAKAKTPGSLTDEPEIEVSFPDTTKNLDAKGTLTIINNSRERITDIKITGLPTKPVKYSYRGKELTKSIFDFANATDTQKGIFPGAAGPVSCLADGTLSRDFCEISLRAERQGVPSERTDSVMLTYTFRGKNYTKNVKLSSTIVDRKELYIVQPIFTSNGLNQEATIKYPFNLTNLSNMHDITNLVIKQPKDSVFQLGQTKVSGIKINKIKSQELTLKYIPTFAGPEFSETWDISYDIGKDTDLEHRTIQFLVHAKATTSPGALQISGYDFGKKTIPTNGQIAIRLNLQNPPIGDDVADLTLLPDGAKWQAEPELELLPTSTCVINPKLAKGQNCFYDIVLKPGASNTSFTYARKLVLAYDNKQVNKPIIKFDLKGDITVLAPGAKLKQTEFPIIIDAKDKVNDPFFPYIKRPLVTNAVNLYSPLMLPLILNRIPKDARQNKSPYFVPWTFKNIWGGDSWSYGPITTLGSIVPDRIKELGGNEDYKENGIAYVKLYHGSAAAYKDAFLKDGIGFDKGVRKAYGQGFYLTADINEAKNYACDAARKAKSDAIILVVGVQDLPEIQGRRAPRSTYQSHETGESKDPKNIYFGAGHTNQFVFYTNAQPYMKIFNLVRLPRNFGMAAGITEEYDGYSTDTTTDVNTPDNDPHGRFRCN